MQNLTDIGGQKIWVMAKGYHPDEGGMQTYAQGVAEAYSAEGGQVTVFTQTSIGPRRTQEGAIRLIDIGPGKSAMVPLRLRRAMIQEARNAGEPSLVHATTWRMAIMPRWLGFPYVVTFHGREFMYSRGPALYLMRKVAADALCKVAVSQFSASKLEGRLGPDAADTVVAWNGLSLWSRPKRPSAAASQPPLILSLCRLEPRKNIVNSIYACATMRDLGLKFRYVIAGRGPDMPQIQAAVEAHRLSDIVEVAGYISAQRAAQLYADADIFLHPQVAIDDGRDFEGFGISIADAMIAATAVIVGAEGGSQELVVHEKTGLIVDGRDQGSIEAALESLLCRTERVETMAKAAKTYAWENFSWSRHIGLIFKDLDM